VVFEVHVDRAGELASQLHLFVDDDGTREIVLSVRGIAQASKQ
jgi:hypothetical protein